MRKMRKYGKFFPAMILPIFMLFWFTTTASAEDAIADADFNDGTMHWNISADNVLTISGTGVMPDYGENVNAPWYPYRSQIRSIVVTDGVTGLGSYAFYGLNSAGAVSLPTSVEALGEGCFYGCQSLAAIDLPVGITVLPYAAFRDCTSLRSIVIPEGVTDLSAGYLFWNCRSLTSITLPGTLQRLGASAWGCFYNTNITDIYYTGTLSAWLSMLFSNEVPMRSPCNLYIGGERLTNLTIPDGVTNIPAYAFQYVNLSSVTLPASVASIGEYAFYGGSAASVRMTNSVTAVGTNAFANCSSLRKVYFAGDQSQWSGIAWNTGNDALIDAERQFVSSLGDDVRTISVGLVEHGSLTVSDAYCTAGDVITVSTQPDLGWRLKCIYVNGAEIAGSSFTAEAGMDYVVTAEFEFYMDVKDHGACGPNLTWYLFDNNELIINGTGPMQFSGGNSPWYNYRGIIRSIAIGEGVTSICRNTFSGCVLVESVDLPNSVERIENYAFQNCSALTSVELPDRLSYVGYDSFSGCPLDSVYYPGDIAGWLRINFDDNTNWNTFPQSVTQNFYIGGELVENLVIPEGVTRIPAAAFKGYRGLRSVSFPDSLQTIGDYAFGGCTNLQSVVFPASVDMIGQYAFSCGLTSVEFMGAAPSMGACAFGETSGYNKSGIVIYYHAGTAGWSSPNWNGYYAACVEAFSDYGALDADNRNAQGVLFTLNEAAKTATVGDGSGNPNNAGYYGAQKGAVVIPDAVTKNGTAYRVIGIGPNAFSRNKHVTSVSIGTGVTSIIPSAFAACPKLEAITVSPGNEYYSSAGGVLYDVSGLYLYVYPGGKADESFAVPNAVKTIGPAAFYDNEYLRSLFVGRNVTAIYRQSFCGLTNLAEITLPFIGTRERNADDSTRREGDSAEMMAVIKARFLKDNWKMRLPEN